MGGNQCGPATGQMCLHGGSKARDIFLVKRHCRLIKAPNGAPRHQEPRKAEAAFLTRTHFACGAVTQIMQIKRIKRRRDVTLSKNTCPKIQVLRHG